MRRLLFASLLVFAAALGPSTAFAAGRMIVPLPPGSAVDTVARHLAGSMGMQHVVSNIALKDSPAAARGLRGQPTDGSVLIMVYISSAADAPSASEFAFLTPVALLGESRSPTGFFGLFGPPGMPNSVVRDIERRALQGLARPPAISGPTTIRYPLRTSAETLAQWMSESSQKQAATPASGLSASAKPQVAAAPASAPTASPPSVAGKWPPGVEPGNLYVVQWHVVTSGMRQREFNAEWARPMLVSARSRADATALIDQKRAEYAANHRESDIKYQIVLECEGPNWGAIASYVRSVPEINRNGYACGARTPREALQAADRECVKNGGSCSADGRNGNGVSYQIGHSGAKATLTPQFGGLALVWSALGATTQQVDGGAAVANNVTEAIDRMGKTCIKSRSGARDTQSCWITAKSLDCIFRVNADSDGLNHQKCVDTALTPDGYRP